MRLQKNIAPIFLRADSETKGIPDRAIAGQACGA
jgi:hypothetical protein